ncbi:hypothetical protein [Pseudovibrio exalbescens]|uniref:hypothetical protein n=1 Tax=Pseudovibrio exalbescens TaxID=197461 RepID=UPI000C9BB62D|nr:hypothetical protein [Pseudovibrio exalbescens]
MTRPSDADIIAAYDKVGTKQGACKYLRSQGFEIPRTTFRRRLNRLSPNGGNPPAGMETRFVTVSEDAQGNVKGRSIKYAEERPQDFEHDPGLAVKGRSTLVDGEGRVIQEWIKEDRKRLDPEFIAREIIETLSAAVPRLDPIQVSEDATQGDLCSQLTLTDVHLAAACYRELSGEDWDLPRAVAFVRSWCEMAMTAVPHRDKLIIAQLGDLLDFDSIVPVTPANKHVLDVSAPHTRMVNSALSLVRDLIRRALSMFREVVFVSVQGNHDESGINWLTAAIGLLFENEPRLEIVQGDTVNAFYRHKNVGLMYTHGHKVPFKRMPEAMVGKFFSELADTSFREVHCGHRHHVIEVTTQDHGLCHVTQHPTMAPNNAYAAHGAYVSERAAVVYHYNATKKFGSSYYTPEMVL